MENYTKTTDYYELTMAQTYFNTGKKDKMVYFDAFFRKIPFGNGYALMGGVDNIIEYIKNLRFTKEQIDNLRSKGQFTEEFLNYLKDFKFTGDVKAIPDGTPIFPNEPIITIRANLIETQIVETTILHYLNSGILYTTAAKRIVDASGDVPVMEFGARRSAFPMMASKCAYIGGCVGTSNFEAGMKYDIPVMGTMAHSLVTMAEDEYDAFLDYAKTYPDNCVLLVDTYDTLNSGVLNAIKVAYDYLIPNGYRLKGIRIDSGDLAYLSKEARKMLDEAGLSDATICLSNGLAAETIESLKKQGAFIDSIGAGDNIAAPKENVGAVYKLVAVEDGKKVSPRIKVSNDAIKTINPGFKKVYRIYDKKTGYAISDLVSKYDEEIPEDKYTLIDPYNQFNTKDIDNYKLEELQVEIFKNGELVYQDMNVKEKQKYCKRQVDTLYEEVRRLDNPALYYVNLTRGLLDLKKNLIEQARQKSKVKMIGE